MMSPSWLATTPMRVPVSPPRTTGAYVESVAAKDMASSKRIFWSSTILETALFQNRRAILRATLRSAGTCGRGRACSRKPVNPKPISTTSITTRTILQVWPRRIRRAARIGGALCVRAPWWRSTAAGNPGQSRNLRDDGHLLDQFRKDGRSERTRHDKLAGVHGQEFCGDVFHGNYLCGIYPDHQAGLKVLDEYFAWRRAGDPATGIAQKMPVFGGACKVCPWGAIGQAVKRSMQPYGYEVQMCYNCNQMAAPLLVSQASLPPPYKYDVVVGSALALPNADGLGPVDFGATTAGFLAQAYDGRGAYAKMAA